MGIKDRDIANVLVTGGAGFMGRWVSKHFVDKGHNVWVLDNLSNCEESNIKEFYDDLAGFVNGDIRDRSLLSKVFKNNFGICVHLAAAINVQQSIGDPQECFSNNVEGTFNVLEECRAHGTKMVFVSSALVYETAQQGEVITENHPLNASCPYTVSKIFGEQLTLSYYRTYNLPAVVLRPFSIYGPWQRSDSEGGVMSIFIDKKLKGETLEVFGSGEQSRDFIFIEDCAEFVFRAALSPKTEGEVFNAGSGEEVRIVDLARLITGGDEKIKFVRHHHPHAEVMNMRASSEKVRRILGWQAKQDLEGGIEKTTQWLSTWQSVSRNVKQVALKRAL